MAQKKVRLAEVFMLQGNKALAVKNLNEVLDNVLKGNDLFILFDSADIYLKLNMVKEASSLADKMERLQDHPYKDYESASKAFARIIEGYIYLSDEKKLEAETEFRKAVDFFNEAKKIHDRWLYRFYLGYVYLKKGDFTEAHSELEQCIKRIQEATSPEYYKYLPLVHYYLGQAQEGLKSPAAVNSYQTFLEIKKRGEDDIIVLDAKKRLAGLRGN